jgi:hypothetical protein
MTRKSDDGTLQPLFEKRRVDWLTLDLFQADRLRAFPLNRTERPEALPLLPCRTASAWKMLVIVHAIQRLSEGLELQMQRSFITVTS